jgi:hypothetical protein
MDVNPNVYVQLTLPFHRSDIAGAEAAYFNDSS